METITLNFKASGQNLTADAHPQRYASNTVNYIQAVFDLDENWQSFDSVRAVWHNDFACISTVLDSDGACTVPHEVLTNLDEVIVNLVGSDVDGEELVDRMTTYPLKVAIIDANARICGTETAEVTPSQFEQFIAQVAELVGSVRDIDRIELNDDYTLTVYYSDGTSWTSTSIRGEQGETGNGIASAVLNDDYTLTLTFTDGTSYTTSSIRGAQGPQGEPGEVTLAQLEQVLPTDTASGAIASFPDGSDLFDYLSCVVEINPVQDLHGYDKPWVGGAGKNKVNNSTNIEGFYTATGNYNYNTDFRTTDLIEVLPSTQYNGALYNNGIYVNKAFATLWDSDGNFIQQETDESFTTTATTKFVRLRNSQSDISVVTSNTYAFQLEKGNTHTSYEPYSNICPITGWTGCEVDVAGGNLFDKSNASNMFDGYFSLTDIIAGGTDRTIAYIKCKPNTTYTASRVAVAANERFGLAWCKELPQGGTLLYDRTSMSQSTTIGDTITRTVTTGADAKYLVCWVGWVNKESEIATLQIELGSTASDYHAYNGAVYPVTWQTEAGTVYGGTVDLVTGVLTVDRVMVTLDGSAGSLSFSEVTQQSTADGTKYVAFINAYNVAEDDAKAMSSQYEWIDKPLNYLHVGEFNTRGSYIRFVIHDQTLDTLAKWNNYLASNPMQLVYELATPQTYQLTPTQIQTLIGQNNVWADCGDVEVQYKADVQRWVEKMLNA